MSAITGWQWVGESYLGECIVSWRMPEQAGRVPMGLRNESLGKGSSNRKTLEIARGVYIFSTTPYSSLLFCLDSVGNEIDRVLLMLLLSSM